MPQLDLMIYFPQFFWFSLGFSVFYIIFLYKIIPTIGYSIKFRKKKLNQMNNYASIKDSNFIEIFSSYFNVLNKILHISYVYLNKINLDVNVCVNSTFKEINYIVFEYCHKISLEKLMKIFLQIDIKLKRLK